MAFNLPRDCIQGIGAQGFNMSLNREFAQLEIVRYQRPRSRWFGDDISAFLTRNQPNTVAPRQPVDWNRMVGLAAVLVILGLSWTAIAATISYLVK